MIRRYTAIIQVPNRHEGCWEPRTLGRFSTVARAEHACERYLEKHPVHETRFQSRRLEIYADVYDVKTNKTIRSIEPNVVIVPSVGELGYW